MKKIISILLAAVVATALLTSCGASRTSSSAAAPEIAQSQIAVGDAAGGTGNSGYAENKSTADSSSGTAVLSAGTTADLSQKIIYSLSAGIETKTFDDTLKGVDALITKYGAFIENSSVSGSSYASRSSMAQTFRNAVYTIRVPVKNFDAMAADLSSLGNVVNKSVSAENITAQFVDTQSRLDTYKTEESRLLAMLAKADTVEDMITIESRLSDVRYQIESLTSTLKNWQNQVDYSTVTLNISEVENLTVQVSSQRSYWERMGDGFVSTLKGVGSFFKSLFLAIVVALPVLVLLAVIAVVVLVIVRVVKKRRIKKSGQLPPQ